MPPDGTRRQTRRDRALGSMAVSLLLSVGVPSHSQPFERVDSNALLAAADALWLRRSEGSSGTQASAELTRRLVAAHEQALDARPDDLEIRWKLLRALHFKGDYTGLADDARLRHYEHARSVADAARHQLIERTGRDLEGLDPPQIAAALGEIPEAAPIYLYSAILWGRWGESTGKMKAARQGVAGKLRELAEVVIQLDERWDGAGGHRFLGRLHTEAPDIPFVTGWIDRRRAVAELERAVQLAPGEPINRVFLADALLRFEDDRRSEALGLLQGVVERRPRPDRLIEDRVAQAEARQLLDREKP